MPREIYTLNEALRKTVLFTKGKDGMSTDERHIHFMEREYAGICQAFGDLYSVILRVFHFYLLLVALPFSIAAIVYRSQNNNSLDIDNLPLAITVLVLLVSFLGLLTTLSMVHLRMEQILYARTINCIRRFFSDIRGRSNTGIESYLSLPITDELPPFFEIWRAFFWQIALVGFIDAAYAVVALRNLDRASLCIEMSLGLLYWILHLTLYGGAAILRQKKYVIRCPAVSGRIDNY
jgi:hypothetical protein